MRTVFMTQQIREKLDIRALLMIVSILKSKESENSEDLDYLQVFEFEDKKLINRQEEPQLVNVYPLEYNNLKDCKIWAVMGLDEVIGEYWTIMYPDEY
ncbi:hypothetical protein [Fusobacterium sp.]|uniref:hypothetical protein n=1 Tax=Fusobacterium sp. TaxID=68766 RepID=UPI002617F22C|nr:hypothetical protein [Fusobacterium sp.]